MTRVKAPTIYDVAQHAGVSHQTVSRFLSGTGGVRPANRERVEAALVALGYRRNNTARSLATSRTFRLGALVHELSGNGPGRAVQGASEAAREAGYALDIVSLDPFGQDDLPGALELLEGRDLEGILATAPTAAVEQALRSLNIPYPIYIDQGSDEDLERGVRAALDHLADLGHRRIAHLAGPAEWRSAQARLNHYLKWMSRRGLVPLPVQYGDWTASSGYAVADQLMAEARPTAIFVGNDRMALGLMLRLHERGVAIPGDVSIVGYDDVAEAEFFHPPLTTIRQDFDAMGRAAISELILLVEARDRGIVEHPVSELIVRASTGRAASET